MRREDPAPRLDLRPRMLALRAMGFPIASIANALGVDEAIAWWTLAAEPPAAPPGITGTLSADVRIECRGAGRQPKFLRRAPAPVATRPEPPVRPPRPAYNPLGQRCVECHRDTPEGSPPRCERCRRVDRQFGAVSEHLTGIESGAW